MLSIYLWVPFAATLIFFAWKSKKLTLWKVILLSCMSIFFLIPIGVVIGTLGVATIFGNFLQTDFVTQLKIMIWFSFLVLIINSLLGYVISRLIISATIKEALIVSLLVSAISILILTGVFIRFTSINN